MLEETLGEQVVSKSTAARICRDTREHYRAWCRRRLDDHDVVYLYLDAIYLKLRPDDEPAEGVLVAWSVTLEGQKVLLGLGLGWRESYDCWLQFGRDLQAHGMRSQATQTFERQPLPDRETGTSVPSTDSPCENPRAPPRSSASEASPAGLSPSRGTGRRAA